jgi:hypothetical protein
MSLKSNLVEPQIIYKICNNVKSEDKYIKNIKIIYKKYLEKHIFIISFTLFVMLVLIYRYNYNKNKKKNNSIIPNNLSYENILELNNLQKKL